MSHDMSVTLVREILGENDFIPENWPKKTITMNELNFLRECGKGQYEQPGHYPQTFAVDSKGKYWTIKHDDP